MTENQEQWILEFAEKAEDHEQWLTFVRFGLNQILENQALLIDLIENEIDREVMNGKNVAPRKSAEVMKIFKELGLKITPQEDR